MQFRISPSILSADLSNLGEEIRACEKAGGADAIHIDVMDGVYVPNITFGSNIVATCRQITTLPLDVHLMIVEPEKHIAEFVAKGADIVTVHYETCPHIHRTLQQIRQSGAKAGLSLNPGTPVEPLALLAQDLDLVLIMSVNPGFGGQKFIPVSLEKKYARPGKFLTGLDPKQICRWTVALMHRRSLQHMKPARAILWRVLLFSNTQKVFRVEFKH